MEKEKINVRANYRSGHTILKKKNALSLRMVDVWAMTIDLILKRPVNRNVLSKF